MPKRVIILGSTGSIGSSALSVADNLPDEFEIVGLAAESRWQRIAEQVERYRPKAAVLSDPKSADKLEERLSELGSDTLVWAGPDALVRSDSTSKARRTDTWTTSVMTTTASGLSRSATPRWHRGSS